MSNLKPLFVYGTLRDAHSNSARFGLSGSCEVTRNVVLNGFDIFDLGSFPGIKPGNGSVVGDLFMVPDELWDRLDSYEGVPHLYTRETVSVAGHDNVQVYVYAGEPHPNSQVTNGDWLNQSEG